MRNIAPGILNSNFWFQHPSFSLGINRWQRSSIKVLTCGCVPQNDCWCVLVSIESCCVCNSGLFGLVNNPHCLTSGHQGNYIYTLIDDHHLLTHLVHPCMHKNTFSSKSTRFNAYFGSCSYIYKQHNPAKVGIKSCRLARECVSFVHAWMYLRT